MEANDAAAVRSGTLLVLVVDDDAVGRRAVGRVLRRANIPFIEATNGRAALAALAEREHEIGVVLMDLDMPELGGEATLVELRARGATVPVVIMTGSSDEDRNDRLLASGARQVLRKPCPKEVLLDAVRAALASLS